MPGEENNKKNCFTKRGLGKIEEGFPPIAQALPNLSK